MAGILQIAHLYERKRVLVAESDLCRQALSMEVHNLRQSQRLQRRHGWLSAVPTVLALAPLTTSFLGLRKNQGIEKRPASLWRRAAGTGLGAWRVYREIGPFLQETVSPWFARFKGKRGMEKRKKQVA
jgi:hypothetical protein